MGDCREATTGETVKRGGITKAGNGRERHMLVESACTYRHPPKVGAKKLYRLEQAPPRVREIAWKAQTRLTARYRMLSGRASDRLWSALRSPASWSDLYGPSPGRRGQPYLALAAIQTRAWAEVGPRQGNARQPL